MSIQKQSFNIGLVAAAFVLAACGVKEAKKSHEGSLTLNSASYLVVESNALESASDSISGEGSVVFVAPLIEDGNNFNLKFELQDSGSLSLIAGSDNKLLQGLTLTFSRNDSVLSFETKVGDTASTSQDMGGIDATKQIAINIDVHNDETPAHILVWKHDSTEELLIDTEESSASAGNGQGNFWGLALKKAKVAVADIRAATNEE